MDTVHINKQTIDLITRSTFNVGADKGNGLFQRHDLDLIKKARNKHFIKHKYEV